MDTTMTRPRTLSVSTLIDEPVWNTQGEKIGEIEDYMLDLDRGCVEYAVLSFGGFLGIGEKLFAIPWESMRLDAENHAWILNVSKEHLKQAPGFDRNNWPDMSDTDYRRSISSFWAVNMSGDRDRDRDRGDLRGERTYGPERDFGQRQQGYQQTYGQGTGSYRETPVPPEGQSYREEGTSQEYGKDREYSDDLYERYRHGGRRRR